MIKPTVGRVLWFWPNKLDTLFTRHDDTTPLLAHVVYVLKDNLVNLVVYDHAGVQHISTSTLLWEGKGDPPAGRYAQWMPYQLGQAARAEQYNTLADGG